MKQNLKSLLTLICLFIGVVVLQTSCSKAPELPISSLTVDKSELEFDKSAGAQKVKINSTAPWSISGLEDAKWLAVTPSTGNGSAEITITVFANDDMERAVTLKVVSGSKSQEISIKQAGKPIELTSYSTIREAGMKQEHKEPNTITESWVVRGTVTSIADGGNAPFHDYYYIQSGEEALIVTAKKGEKLDLEEGDLVTINLNGGTLTRFYDDVQVTPASPSMVTKTAGDKVEPLEITAKELSEKLTAGQLIGVLVKVSDLQFTDQYAKDGQTMYQGTEFFFRPSIVAKDGTDLKLQICKNVKFKDEPIPTGSGSIIGFASKFKSGPHSIIPRVYGDLTMTGDRFEVENGGGDPSTPVDPSTITPLSDVIAAAMELKGKETKTVTEPWVIKVTVTTNESGSNKPFGGYYFAQSGDQAIVLILKKDDNLKMNEELSIDLTGAKIKNYFGQTQIEIFDNAKILSKKAATPIHPLEITAKELSNKASQMLGRLVKLVDVQYEPYDGMTFSSNSRNNTVVGKDGTTIVARVNKESAFTSSSLPSGSGYIIGHVGTFKGDAQIFPNSLDEIKMTGARFTPTADGGSSTGGDTGSGGDTGGSVDTSGEPMITEIYTGGGNNKYVELYNPTDKEITLDGYSLSLEVFNGKNNPSTSNNATFELDGLKIAAKSTLVFAKSGSMDLDSSVTMYQGEEDQQKKLNRVINFNGNDPVMLKKGDTVIDIIGEQGKPLTDGSGKNKYQYSKLVRKTSSTSASTTFNESDWEVISIPRDKDAEMVKTLGKR